MQQGQQNDDGHVMFAQPDHDTTGRPLHQIVHRHLFLGRPTDKFGSHQTLARLRRARFGNRVQLTPTPMVHRDGVAVSGAAVPLRCPPTLR